MRGVFKMTTFDILGSALTRDMNIATESRNKLTIEFNLRIIDTATLLQKIMGSLFLYSVVISNMDEVFAVRCPRDRNNKVRIMIDLLYHNLDISYTKFIIQHQDLLSETCKLIPRYDQFTCFDYIPIRNDEIRENGYYLFVNDGKNGRVFKIRANLDRLVPLFKIGKADIVQNIFRIKNGNLSNLEYMIFKVIRSGETVNGSFENEFKQRNSVETVVQDKDGYWSSIHFFVEAPNNITQEEKLVSEMILLKCFNTDSFKTKVFVSKNLVFLKEIYESFKKRVDLRKDSDMFYDSSDITNVEKSVFRKCGFNFHCSKNQILSLVKKKDLIIINPYITYDYVIDFIEACCDNDMVDTVLISLYRVDPKGRIIKALTNAASLGKFVGVYLEIMARGNENVNLELIENLEKSGCHIITNMRGYKTHAKGFVALTYDGKFYTHVGTGNYNEKTVLNYVDVHLLTYNQQIGYEVYSALIQIIKGEFPACDLEHERYLWTSPVVIREKIISLIKDEQCKEDGLIYLKANGITDKEILNSLSKAALSGCDIVIDCRTACAISRRLPNLTLLSTTGRFLEHSRIFIFGSRVFIASCDLMTRNLDKRVEFMIEIPNGDMKIALLNLIRVDIDMPKFRKNTFRWIFNQKQDKWVLE